MNQGLVEGIDYYLEDGKLVFTAEYHLKRGYCCNSKCRHCPFRSEDAARVEIPTLPKLSSLGARDGPPGRRPRGVR